jgi:hypothetical protein
MFENREIVNKLDVKPPSHSTAAHKNIKNKNKMRSSHSAILSIAASSSSASATGLPFMLDDSLDLAMTRG